MYGDRCADAGKSRHDGSPSRPLKPLVKQVALAEVRDLLKTGIDETPERSVVGRPVTQQSDASATWEA